MNLSLLSQLKRKLIKEDDFSKIWDFFFNHFGEDPAFFRQGQSTEDEVLKASIQEGVDQMFGREVEIQHLILYGLPRHKFIHGGFAEEGRPGTVLYFEDLQMGLSTVPFMPPNNETKVARFTAVVLPAPSNN